MVQNRRDCVIVLTQPHYDLLHNHKPMKFLFEIFPVILFFVTYNLAGKFPAESQQLASQFLSKLTNGKPISESMAPILLATSLAIAASIFQVVYLKLRRQKIAVVIWVTFGIMLFFGGATIYFQNDTFIKLKPTIIYVLNAIGFLFSDYFFNKNPMKLMMQKEISVSDDIWRKCNLGFVFFSLAMGALNLYVAFSYSQSTWVSFKLYSLAALPVFLIGLMLYLSKHIPESEHE